MPACSRTQLLPGQQDSLPFFTVQAISCLSTVSWYCPENGGPETLAHPLTGSAQVLRLQNKFIAGHTVSRPNGQGCPPTLPKPRRLPTLQGTHTYFAVCCCWSAAAAPLHHTHEPLCLLMCGLLLLGCALGLHQLRPGSRPDALLGQLHRLRCSKHLWRELRKATLQH